MSGWESIGDAEGRDQALEAALDLALAPEQPAEEPTGPDEPATEAVEEAPEEPTEEAPEEGSEEPAPAAYTVGDETLSDQDLQELINLRDWAATVEPHRAAQIQLLLSGQYDEILRGGAPVAAPAVPAPEPTPEPDLFAGIDTDMVDPGVLRLLQAQQAQFKALQAELLDTRQQAEQALHTQAQDHFTKAAERVQDNLRNQYGFTDDELGRIAQVATPLIEKWAPGYNDPEELFTAALDHTIWTTPNFRELALAHRAESAAADAVDSHAKTSAQIAEKKQRAAAVSTTSGSIPRQDPVPRNMTKADKQLAMASEIAEMITGP